MTVYQEMLYADDLVIMAETMEELSIKLENWKSGMEAKGLRVNTKKTKVMISHPDADPVWEISLWSLLKRCQK